jgi:hypothetical protein
MRCGSVRPDGETFRVTPIETAMGDRWSDVTAILEVSVYEGTFVFELDDIHVL